MMKKLYFIWWLCALPCLVFAQSNSKRVLFLGNSYTAVNNLPQTVVEVALSAGDTLYTDAHAPGGYTLMGHSGNSTSLAKLTSQPWDYVVLQEQSQLPSFPISQVEAQVFPYARMLDSLIHAANSCAQTIFYMTWGRKNGDAQNCTIWPPVCTYSGMDSLLNLRYRIMAAENDALVSPVGAVWNYLRVSHPGIELYQADESHPSVAGTYAAACCFYTTIFQKDPTRISYNSSLSEADASAIRLAVKNVVYLDMLQWHIGEYVPHADFNINHTGSKTVNLTNLSIHAAEYIWDFGDGTTSADVNPLHTYLQDGQYTIRLTATACGVQDTAQRQVTITTTTDGLGYDEHTVRIYPNPGGEQLFIAIHSRYAGLPYEIIDMTGRSMQSGILSTHETQLSTQHLPPGFYWVKVGFTVHKWVKR